MLKLYGQEVNLFKLGRMPAQVLIDKAGVARYVHYGHNMSDIPKNEELLALGDEINALQRPFPRLRVGFNLSDEYPPSMHAAWTDPLRRRRGSQSECRSVEWLSNN